MATIRKVGKKWRAEVRRKGVCRSKRFDAKRQAEEWAKEEERKIEKNPGVDHSRSLRDAIRRYREDVSPTLKGARWEIIRLNKLESDALSNIMLADLTSDDIQAWIGRQTTGPGTINRYLNQLSSVLRVSRERWKWMAESHNPMRGIRRPKNPKHRERVISAKEMAILLRALDYKALEPVKTMRQEIAVAAFIALETAMRQSELWGLHWSCVHLQRRFVHLPDTKNGESRNVSLSRRAIRLFKKLSPTKTGRVFKSNQASAGVIFLQSVKTAGINDFTFHDLRHSAVTRLAKKLDKLTLAKMTGHKKLESLMIYYNPTPEDIAKRLG